MRPRRHQKPSLLLVVAGGFRGVLLPCVQTSASFLFGKSIHVTICFVSDRQCISSWSGCDLCHMYHSVIPHVYVGSSYCSLSGGLLHLCHGDRSSPGREAWMFVACGSRACCWWWQEGVEVFTWVQDSAYIYICNKSLHIYDLTAEVYLNIYL